MHRQVPLVEWRGKFGCALTPRRSLGGRKVRGMDDAYGCAFWSGRVAQVGIDQKRVQEFSLRIEVSPDQPRGQRADNRLVDNAPVEYTCVPAEIGRAHV